MDYSSSKKDTGSVNTFSPTTSSFDEPCDPATCIDPPGSGGSGGGPSCTPTDQYRLEASVNSSGAYTYNSSIPTNQLTPYWGSIILTAKDAIGNTSQNGSPYHDSNPFHEVFDLDRKVKVTTTLTSGGQLNFSLSLFDMYARAWFSSNNGFISNADVVAEADEINIEGTYTLVNDNFSLTDFEFENLNVSVSLSGFTGWLADVFGYTSTAESEVEDEIKNLISNEINSFNANNPNMYVKSLIDYQGIENILPALDLAIAELVKDDVDATLLLALPSCGDITRDGLIKLNVTTN